jgi:CRP-like cAMP-binding protein
MVTRLLHTTSDVGCAFCPIGGASHVSLGGDCPMIDRRRGAGTFLYLADTPADTIYYVKHGTIALSRTLGQNRGEDAPHTVRHAGSLIGLEAIVHPTYLDSARAITDVTVCATSREQMKAWLEQSGTSKVVLERVLGAMAKDTPGRATTDGNAKERVARWLLDSRHTRETRLPRSVLAGLLGMKPETLSRALAAIARTKCIHVTRARIDVKDAPRLEAIASGTARK